jgi:hypothetical protein
MLPPAEAPEDGAELTLPDADGDVLTPPDVDGELTLPVAGELTVLPEGELVLRPEPLVAPELGALVLELIDPELPELTDPDALRPEEPTDPDAPGVDDVVGDADGLLETPAACIAIWLQRSKSARVMVPAPMAAAGSRSATLAVIESTLLALVMETLLPEGRGECRFIASSREAPSVRFASAVPAYHCGAR